MFRPILSLKFFYFLFIFLFSTQLWASDIVNPDPLKATAYLKSSGLASGGNTPLYIDLDLAAPHHAYLEQFQLKIISPKEVLMGKFEITPVVDFFDTITKKNKKGVKGKATLKTLIEIPETSESELLVKFQLRYQACTKKYCLLPKKIPLELKIPILDPRPSSLSDSTQATPKEDSLLQKAAQKGLISLFFFVFVAGILTSFTPCIYPMIPITLAILGNPTHGGSTNLWKRFSLSLVYVSGISLTYSILGLIAASTGALFGSILGHPVAVFFICSFFIAMGLSMFGLFEIQAPAFLRNKAQSSKKSSGYIGAFFSGLVAGVVAGPCVGPVLVSILALVAQSQNQTLGFFLLMFFALGFGQIFILLGTFSHLTKMLPKSGPWMNGIKYIFGIIMIGSAVYFAKPVVDRYVFNSSKIESHGILKWEKFSEEKIKQAQLSKRPIVIDFWAEWCGACIELEKKSFAQKEVSDFILKNNFLLLKFDATVGSDELERLKKKYKILGLPHIVFYPPGEEFNAALTLKGFEDHKSLLQRLKKVMK